MIIVYTTPSCMQCTATKQELERRGLPYELIDMSEDVDALNKVRDLGYRQAPVVMTADDHWSGFRPDKIAALAAAQDIAA